MMRFLRSQSQTVLVLVLGVIALGFLFYGNSGNFLSTGAGRTSSDYGAINGEDLTVAELTDAIRTTRESLMIHGQSEALKQPGASAQVAELAWSQLLLQREAERLHIAITDQELVDYIHTLSIFQKDGVYSPDVYESRMGELKAMLHLPSDTGTSDSLASTKEIFATVLRNDLTSEAVSKALFSGVRSSAQDVSEKYEKIYGPATVSLVTFDPKTFVASAKVTPDEVAAEYKAHPENPAYRTEEKRKVDYVLFLLTPDQMKLPDAQKATAKDALGQQALDFALAFQPEPSANGDANPAPPDFTAEAKKRGLAPATTDFFTTETPPAGLPPSPSFNSAAFALTKDEPISKVVDLDNGVAVLHLAEIEPSDLKPLADVQADITQQLQAEKGKQSAQLTAEITAKALQSAVQSGKDFKTIAASMNQKVETIPALIPIKAPQGDQRMQAIAYATTTLKPGQVSDPVPVPSDGSTLIIHLDSRDKADPAGLAEFESRFRDSSDARLRQDVTQEWASWKSKQPGTRKPPELDSFGSVD